MDQKITLSQQKVNILKHDDFIVIAQTVNQHRNSFGNCKVKVRYVFAILYDHYIDQICNKS